jgi:hypothetical protein
LPNKIATLIGWVLRPVRKRTQVGKPLPQSGFALVAQRISAWTTRGLLTLIILIAGLGFGRQVLRWWAADDNPAGGAYRPDPADGGLGDPSHPHVIQFGDQPWSIRRQSLAGTTATAADGLRGVCRELIGGQARLPIGQPEQAERDLLAKLQDRRPIEQEQGKWQLYELSEGLPMVVGTREMPAPSSAVGGSGLAQTTRRVVIWGLAIPAGLEAWTVYTFQPVSSSDSLPGEGPEVPLPPGSRRLVSLRTADGGAIAAFAGPEQPDAWVEFYRAWSVRHDWKPVQDWQRVGSRWHARYTSATGEPPTWIDVQFGPDGRGQYTGLVVITR